MDIQVSADNKQKVVRAHGDWNRNLPRLPGQIGSFIAGLVEASPIYIPGEVTTYSDFAPVRFVGIDPAFAEYLREQGIPFDER